jgi:hypothetical protein
MMEGYLIVMRRVAALRRSGHWDDCALLQRDALYRLIRALERYARVARRQSPVRPKGTRNTPGGTFYSTRLPRTSAD